MAGGQAIRQYPNIFFPALGRRLGNLTGTVFTKSESRAGDTPDGFVYEKELSNTHSHPCKYRRGRRVPRLVLQPDLSHDRA